MSRHRWMSMSDRRASSAPCCRRGRAYCRLTLAFVIGLYLPTAFAAPDLARHFGEALHSWTIVFFAPLAVWGLVGPSFWRVTSRKPCPGEPAKR